MGQVKHCTSGHCATQLPRFRAICSECRAEVRYENGVVRHLDASGAVFMTNCIGRVTYLKVQS